MEEHRVIAGATVNLVAPAVVAPRVDRVVAIAAREPVLAEAAEERVIPVGTADHVVAIAAAAGVIAISQHHGVVSGQSPHAVIAAPGVDKVGPVGPDQAIWAARTLDELGQCGSAKQHGGYKKRHGERHSNLACAP